MVAIRVLFVTTCVFATLFVCALADPPRQVTPVAPAAPANPPDESRLYLWTPPDRGTQSLLILRVVDAETVEAAYLAPVVLKLSLKTAAKYDRTAKAFLEGVDKEIGGKVLHAELRGRDDKGRVQADLWLGKDAGWASERWSK